MAASGSAMQPNQPSETNSPTAVTSIPASHPTGGNQGQKAPAPPTGTQSQTQKQKHKHKSAAIPAGMDSDPPPFLANLLRGEGIKINEGAALKKRPPPLPIQGVPPLKKVCTPTPATQLVTAPAPTSSRNQTAPGSKIATGKLIPGALWESGLSNELKEVIRPPKVFTEPKLLTNGQVQELEKFQQHGLQINSLVAAVISLNRQYATSHAKFLQSEEGKKKTYEELLACKSELKGAKAGLESLKTTHNGVLGERDQAVADLKTANEKIEELKRQLVDSQAETTDAKALANAYLNDLSMAVDGSFTNCKKQVLFLNPGIELNLDGLHPRAYVKSGVFFPAPPAPASPSASQATLGEINVDEDMPDSAVETPAAVMDDGAETNPPT